MKGTSIRKDNLSVKRLTVLKNVLSLPSLLLLMLWTGINTGPWVLESDPKTFLSWLNYLRTLFPTLILLVTALILFTSHNTAKLPPNARQWLLYGLISSFACILSPDPFSASYWAVAYLAAFGAMKLFLKEDNLVDRALHLNYLTWIITVIFLSVLILVAHDSLFVSTDTGLSGYGIEARVRSVAEMPMSRSSGMARFAAIPGIIAFALFWRAPKWQRFGWGILFLYSAALIYLMQSRGAIFAFVFSLSFVLIFLGFRTRIWGVILIIIFGTLLFSDTFSTEFVDRISEHLGRHQSREELLSLTGRARAWAESLDIIRESPVNALLGWGFQADRMLIRQHVHNTYLYALLTAGITGFAAFVFGLIITWKMFFRTLESGITESVGHKVPFVICGGILSFFTVRSIPEVSGALFGVDFMIMLPIVTYIGIMDRQRKALVPKPETRNKIKITW